MDEARLGEAALQCITMGDTMTGTVEQEALRFESLLRSLLGEVVSECEDIAREGHRDCGEIGVAIRERFAWLEGK